MKVSRLLPALIVLMLCGAGDPIEALLLHLSSRDSAPQAEVIPLAIRQRALVDRVVRLIGRAPCQHSTQALWPTRDVCVSSTEIFPKPAGAILRYSLQSLLI